MVGMGRNELNKYIFTLVGISAAVLIGLVVAVMGIQDYLGRPQKTVAFTPEATPTAAAKKTKVSDFSNVTVADWGQLPDAPTFEPPVRTTIYALKQQYNDQEFANLAQHFVSVNGNKVSQKEDSMSVVSSTASATFYMYKPTGSFMYKSEKGIDLPEEQGFSDEEKVNTFMNELWNDGTLQVTRSYQNSAAPGVTYYEAHRDWDKIGLPIINLMSTFNLPAEEKVGELSLLKRVNEASDRDISVNTAVIGVKDGKIISITSNIRAINRQGTSHPQGVISYNEAISRLKKNDFEYILTSPPVGSGDTGLTKVTVTEAVPVYLEELPGKAQTQLYPYYVFRGEGETGAGTKVKFAAAVPAVSAEAYAPVSGKQTRTRSQQQGTLEFIDPTNMPAPSGAMSAAAPDEGKLSSLTCSSAPSPKQLANKAIDPSGFLFGEYNSTLYIIPMKNWDVSHLDDINALSGPGCPLRLSL